MNLETGLFDRPSETWPDATGHSAPAAAEIAEMPIAADEEMLGRHLTERHVIHVDRRDAQPVEHACRVDDRLAELEDAAGELGDRPDGQ